MFHPIKGQNITLDPGRATATWNPIQSGGLAFTDRPITADDKVTVTLEGTGAIELGVTTTDPKKLPDDMSHGADCLPNYCFLNDIKIHKRQCTMTIVLDSEKKEIRASFSGGKYRAPINDDFADYLVADVKYGQVEIKLETEGEDGEKLHFSETCGRNMKRLNNPAVVTSLAKSPAALCFYSEAVTPDLDLRLQCSTMTFQNTIPGRYYLQLRYSTQSPHEFLYHHPGHLDLRKPADPENSSSYWFPIDKLEKDECTKKPVYLKFTGGNVILETATGKRKRLDCRLDEQNQVWLVLELYGISVKIERINASSCGIFSDIPEERDESFSATTRSQYMTVHGSGSSSELAGGVSDTMPVSSSSRGELGHEGSSSSSESSGDTLRSLAQSRLLYSSNTQPHSSLGTSMQPPSDLLASLQIDDPVQLRWAIQKNFIYLKENLQVGELIDHMYQSFMITRHELNSLQDKDNVRATRMVLIDILSKRPVSKKAFIKALEKTLQQYLIEYFIPLEEKE